MPPLLHIIASCTDRKRAPVTDRYQLRNYHGERVRSRASEWSQALATSTSPRLEAAGLYSGDHWKVVRTLSGSAQNQGWRTALWIASAGYGLIPDYAPIVPYSATFAPGLPDSIAADQFAEELGDWWSALAERPGPVSGVPRTVTALATSEPDSTVLVIASPAYIQAMERDLSTSAATLHEGKLLIISSAPGPRDETLKARWIASGARHQRALGGSLISLHARLARRLLETLTPIELNLEAANGVANLLVRSTFASELGPRASGSDDEIKAFIRRAIQTDPSMTHSRLLRVFRQEGRACEQGRFRNLFVSIQGAS